MRKMADDEDTFDQEFDYRNIVIKEEVDLEDSYPNEYDAVCLQQVKIEAIYEEEGREDEIEKRTDAILKHHSVRCFVKLDQSVCLFNGKIIRNGNVHMKKPTKSTEEEAKCNLCQKIFNGKKYLKRHLKRHSGFICNECQKVFESEDNLQEHLQCHSEGAFKCNECQKFFLHEATLRRHLRIIHLGEGLFTCGECQKTFIIKSTLFEHLKSLCGPRRFECNECQKRLTSKDYLNQHLGYHSDEKPFKCHECQKGFTCQGILVNHLRRHPGQRSLIRDTEKTLFPTINLEESPIKSTEKAFPCKSGLTGQVKIQFQESSLKCDDCEKVFPSKGALREHLACHSDQKPFICNQCPKVFTYVENLKDHLRRLHTEHKA